MQAVADEQQFADQLVGLLITVFGLLGQQRVEDRHDLIVQIRPEQAWIRRMLAAVAQQLLQQRPFGKRRLAGEHEVERAAQRVQVAADVRDPRVPRLLRRDVVEGSERHAAGRQVVSIRFHAQPSQTHVHQLGAPFGGHQDVRRLDVPVDDMTLRGVLQGLGYLQHVADRFAQRQRSMLARPDREG